MKLLVAFRMIKDDEEHFANAIEEIEAENEALTEELIQFIMEDLKEKTEAEMILIFNIIKLEG